ncbi:pyruvate, water dikinase regulatory protein [Tuberibacillus sp. Marseille-P3662]|uniref:pyruvate, water dikinase regulatory protein n=1 Tax=Tuberibacillus sp. Marseille-P3662 TaxID=1965358 RepID=UPI000A1CAA66|nr:pyruvate, water dikinase regulatory protein [Tuberibacillus sp. Marseille-P3662]
MGKTHENLVYIVSDSVGETAELVIKAASSQFRDIDIDVQRFPYVEDRETIDEIVQAAKENQAMIAYTLVVPEIKNDLLTKTEHLGIDAVDIMGPAIKLMEQRFNKKPRYEPGLIHKLDEDYFRRVEAIEFAVKYDDGRDPRGILRADVVLVGVSRTSKTPLSQYLAHKRLKVANVPVVPEVEPPEELFQVDPRKCFGLRISPEQLNHIRKERLIALGLDAQANYAKMDRIKKELQYFEDVVDRIGCQIIDVSSRAVEETANVIFSLYQRKN